MIRGLIPILIIIVLIGVGKYLFNFILDNLGPIIIVLIFAFISDIVITILLTLGTWLGLINLSFFSGPGSILFSFGFILLYLGLGFVLFKIVFPKEVIRDSGGSSESRTAKELKIEPLLKQLEKPDYKLKENVAIKLGKTGDSRFVEPLIKCLGHPDKDVRIAAIKGLGYLGDQRAVKPIFEVLTHDWSDIARREAASVLGKLQDPRAVEPLLKGFSKADPANWQDYDYHLRALRKMDTLAVPGLIKMLDDPHPARRADTAKLLGQIGDPSAIEPLNKLLLNDGDAQVHMKVVTALVLLNSRAHGDAVH
jgi:HEAT repeat protein